MHIGILISDCSGIIPTDRGEVVILIKKSLCYLRLKWYVKCHYLVFSRLHATLKAALSVRRSVGPSVGHTLLFLVFLRSLASLFLPK